MAPTVQDQKTLNTLSNQTGQQTSQSPQPTKPASPVQAPRPNVGFLLAAVLAFGILAGVVLWGQGKVKQKSQDQEQTPAPQFTPPVVVMKDYTNSGYNFGFKYNEVWDMQEASAEAILGSRVAFGFTFKNTLPEATRNAVPNLPKLVVYVFDKNPSLDNFIGDLAGDRELKGADCPGGIKQCKRLLAKDTATPFPVQVARQGANYTYGFAMFDENAVLANLNSIPQPLGAVVNNFTSE